MTAMDIFASTIPRPYGKEISTLFQVPFPNVQNGTYRFKFNARIQAVNYLFNFWYSTVWNIAVTFPDGSIRTAALIPNVTQWSAYTDYGLYPSTTIETIGQNDLSRVSLYMVAWK